MLLVVCNEGLGKGLSDGVDLCNASTTLDPDPDVDIGKTILAQQKNWLLELVLKRIWLNLI